MHPLEPGPQDIRGGSQSAPTIELPPDAIVRAESPDGVVLYSRADGGAGPALHGVTNVVGAWIELTALSGLASAASAIDAAAWLEDRLARHHGLWRLPDRDDAIAVPEAWSQFEGDAGTPQAPALLLIHGTFSLPTQSFAALAGTAAWRALRRRYPGRILAHAGPTLSISPVASAIDLARALPVGAVVDVLSYSRGGLVGELLADPPPPLDEQIWKALAARTAGRGREWEQVATLLQGELATLRTVLAERRISVQHHLRVAAPLLGTPLTSIGLERWLSLLLAAHAVLPADAMTGFVERTALELIHRGATVAQLPGLAAMDPDAPLIRALALRDRTRIPTFAVTGEVVGNSLLGRYALDAVDHWFGEPSDLVVPTGAMVSAGFAAGNGALEQRLALRGADAHHFGYFAHPQLRDLLTRWPEPAAVNRGIAAFALGLTLPLLRNQLPDAPTWPAVILLPGFAGTSLRKHADHDSWRIWPDAVNLLRGGFTDLRLDPPRDGIRPEGPLDAYYGSLARALAREFDVHPYGYDWRDAIPAIADRLAAYLSAEVLPRNPDRPIHLVAHSMGGVVAMTLLWRHQGLADELEKRQSKLVCLGTPTAGTLEPVFLALGRHELLDLLELADLVHTRDELLAVIRSFRGLFQLMPKDLDPALLAALGLATTDRQAVDEFLQLRDDRLQQLGAGLSLPLHYVHGRARSTIADVELDVRGRARFRPGREGDGTVLWKSGRAGAPQRQWWAKIPHARLAADIDPQAVIDILRDNDSSTDRLLPPPPEPMRWFDLRDGEPATTQPATPKPTSATPARIPGILDLIAAALGDHPDDAPADAAAPVVERLPLTVSVVHGSLHTSADLVVLGVFEGLPPGELALLLDRQTDGAITRLWRTGGWPLYTGAWCIVGDSRRPTALLINLGRNGSLTRRSVVTAMTRTLRAWMLTVPRDAAPAISAALVGSDGANVLGPEELAIALVEAVLRANRALASHGDSSARLRGLTLYEPYRDIAARVAYALQNFSDWTSLEFDPRELAVSPELIRSEGYFAVRPGASSSWSTWSTLTISAAQEPGAWRLTVTTGDRMAARFQQQIHLPDALMRRLAAMASAGPDESRAASEVFAAASTRDLREFVRAGTGLLLQLDPLSAAIPWELLLRGVTDEDLEPRDAVLRMLQEERRVTDLVPATARTALVIGDPLPAGLPALAGARLEADGVRAQLRAGPGGGWTIAGRNGADATEVLASLGSAPYRILHIATHGRIIGDLTEIHLGGGYWEGASLLDRVPELPQFVFLNACHSGAQLDGATAFAASTARAFLRRGVQAIVVAGWAVHDGAARTFAEALYHHILDGESFGRAVRAARLRTRREHPTVNTWGAYQCYGNPLAVLVPEARLDRRLRTPPFCPGVDEARDAIHSLHGDARLLGPERREELRVAIQRHRDALPPSLAKNADVLRKLAMIWLEVGDIERAGAAFDAALSQFTNTSGGLIEWAADTASRLAAHRPKDAADRNKQADRLLAAAVSLRPKHESLQMVIAHHAMRQGKWTDAQTALYLARTTARERQDKQAIEGRRGNAARYHVDAALLDIALGQFGWEQFEAMSRELVHAARDAYASRDIYTRRILCDLVLLRYVFGSERDIIKVGQAYRKALRSSVSLLWSDIVSDFLGCIQRAAREHEESNDQEQSRLIAAIDEILGALADDAERPAKRVAPDPDAHHRVIVRHLRPEDSELTLRWFPGSHEERAMQAYVTGLVAPRSIREMVAADLIVEDLGPVGALPAAPPPDLPLLFRDASEPRVTWPGDVRVESHWPFVDELMVAIHEIGGEFLARLGSGTVLARLDHAGQLAALQRHPAVRSVRRHGLADSGPFVVDAGPFMRGDTSESQLWDITLARSEDMDLVLGRLGALNATGPEETGTDIAVPSDDSGVAVPSDEPGMPSSVPGVDAVWRRARTIRVRTTAAMAAEIAGWSGVVRVAALVPTRLTNDRVRALVGVDPAGLTIAGSNITLDGAGEVIAIADSGLDVSHPDFTKSRVTFLGDKKKAAVDSIGHGTHVAGIVVASGAHTDGQLRGIAPQARLVIQKIADRIDDKVALSGLPPDLRKLLDEARRAGANIHNWSWGAAACGDYTADADEVDAWLHEHPEQLLVVAAGNEGTSAPVPGAVPMAKKGFVEWRSVTSPATAKNALVVGASRGDRTSGGRADVTYGNYDLLRWPEPPTRDETMSGNPEEVAAFSGRGPTISEQIRPDIVAPGTDVLSTMATGTLNGAFYGVDLERRAAYLSGTSMAAPVVTGCAALVRQYYREVRGVTPSAALLKATLIAGARWLHGASSLAEGERRPNVHQGFGRIDLAGTIPQGDPSALAFFEVPDGDRFQQRKQFHTYRIFVGAARPIRICLVYTDAPGKGLQNDLQLQVDHDGARHVGNRGRVSGPVAYDRHNNVKIVDIEALAAGECRIQVAADSLPRKPQGYALVVLGELSGGLIRVKK